MWYTPLASMIKQLKEFGHDEVTATKIATKQLQNAGVLEKGTMKMTKYGKERHKLNWNARKIDRRAKSSWRPAFHFFVDQNWKVKLHQSFKHLR